MSACHPSRLERSVGVCELAQQPHQLTALVLGERREYPLLDFVEHVVERPQLLAPGGGDRDDVAAPVVGVDRALDQSEPLQLAQHGNDVAAVDARAAPEVRLADRTPFLERREQAVVVAAKSSTAGREPVVQQPVRAAVSTADQPGRPVPDAGRCRHLSRLLLGHRASVALAGVTNISYVGSTYIGVTNIREPSCSPCPSKPAAPPRTVPSGSW